MGIRVDGRDTLTQTIPAGALGATNGKIAFYWTPRHGGGDMEKFGSVNPVAGLAYKNATNFIRLLSVDNNRMRISVNIGGVNTDGADWTPAGALVAGTKYLVELEYNSVAFTFSIDGAVVDTATPVAGIDFGANIPDTFYAGSNQTGVSTGDAVFS